MKRSLTALLLAAGLLLTGCGGNQSGDSNSDNLVDEAPGVSGDAVQPSSASPSPVSS